MWTSKQLAVVAIGFCLASRAGLCLAQKAGDVPAESVLLPVKFRLQKALGDLDPPVFVRIRDGKLTAEWRTRKFQIHPRNPSGEIADETREEVGPGHLGFILTVHDQPVSPAKARQTVDLPYWKTDIDVQSTPGGKRQLNWTLSYGARTDEALLEKIRKSLSDDTADVGRSEPWNLPALMAASSLPMIRPDPAITFDRLDVLIGTGVLGPRQSAYLLISRGGQYLYKVPDVVFAKGQALPAAVFVEPIPAGRLAELQRLLEATQWLEAPGGEGPATHTDAVLMKVAVTRGGKVRTIQLDGSRPAPYAALQHFISDLAWQEDLYYRMTRVADRQSRDAHFLLQNEIDQRLAALDKPPARYIGFERFADFFREPLEEPFRFRTEELRTAIDLMLILKRKDKGPAIARMRHDRDPNLRRAVARALPVLMEQESIPLLAEMIESTDEARLALIGMREPAVPTIASVIGPDVSRDGLRSVKLIRTYIDHWKKIAQPIDARIVQAVVDNMQRKPVRQRGLEYHREFLKLAGVAEPRPPSAQEMATAFLAHLQSRDVAALENISDNVGSIQKWLAARDTLDPSAELALERIFVDKDGALLISRPCRDKSGDEVRLVARLNLYGLTDWLVGPALIQTPTKDSYIRHFHESNPNAKEIVP